MQDLEGDTLATLLRQGPLDVETAIRYASEIGVALDAAHSRGIVHGDLTPAHVLITPAGARLLDLEREVPRPSAEGVGAASTPLERHPSDARTDIFSFGAMFYEMLTGRRPPVAAADAAVLPLPPSRVNRDVPPAVDIVVLRCLAGPADRWRTMRAVLNALTVALNAAQVTRALRAGAPRWGYAAAAMAILAITVAAGCPYLNRDSRSVEVGPVGVAHLHAAAGEVLLPAFGDERRSVFAGGELLRVPGFQPRIDDDRPLIGDVVADDPAVGGVNVSRRLEARERGPQEIHVAPRRARGLVGQDDERPSGKRRIGGQT
jgi:hypothetical protein